MPKMSTSRSEWIIRKDWRIISDIVQANLSDVGVEKVMVNLAGPYGEKQRFSLSDVNDVHSYIDVTLTINNKKLGIRVHPEHCVYNNLGPIDVGKLSNYIKSKLTT